MARRRLSAVEVTTATIETINRLNPTFNAFIGINPGALDQAREADRRLARRERLPLLGVPIAVKDLILGRDGPTTAGSKIFGNGIVSDHDAPVLARLRRAGAVIIGRANLHEVALGVTNENEHFGPARNPWDPSRIPGGSSGGSAVAVASGMCTLAVGTDTRGSIRIPAACCGVTGLKPTYGLVPTEEVIPLAWSLDHVGPIARTIEDAAIMLGAMVGGRSAKRYLDALSRPVRKLRIGICDYLLRDLEREIEAAVLEAIEWFRRAGAKTRNVSIEGIEQAHGVSATITLAEAVTYHDRSLKERPGGFGTAIRERLEKGYGLTALDLVLAERERARISQSFDEAFREVDCIVGATLPAFPSPIGKAQFELNGRATNLLAEFPRLTSPANLSGGPAVSIPCGFGTGGLPIGLQLIADVGRDDVVLAAAAAYQGETNWHARERR
jgi:aspartyl-tRNA(Asn)/glutamyl-tRNA(Gln) amidotransferase subunit A